MAGTTSWGPSGSTPRPEGRRRIRSDESSTSCLRRSSSRAATCSPAPIWVISSPKAPSRSPPRSTRPRPASSRLPASGRPARFRLPTDALAGGWPEDLPHLQLLRGPGPSRRPSSSEAGAARPSPGAEAVPRPRRVHGHSWGRGRRGSYGHSSRPRPSPSRGSPGCRVAARRSSRSRRPRQARPAAGDAHRSPHRLRGWARGAAPSRHPRRESHAAAIATLELRVHRVRSSGPFDVECAASVEALLAPGERITRELPPLLRDQRSPRRARQGPGRDLAPRSRGVQASRSLVRSQLVEPDAAGGFPARSPPLD